MAKYRLVQDNVPINFNTADFKDLKNDNLKDIIKFTGFFKSQEELKEYLRKYKLINSNNQLKIIYKYNHKDKNLIYGLTYRDDVPFLDPVNIARFLEQNKYDQELLNNLCNHYRNSYINGGNVYAIRDYIMTLKEVQVALDDETEIVRKYKYIIKDFIRKECYKYDKKEQKEKINFKGMRDLGMFLANQRKKNDNLTMYAMVHPNELSEYIKAKKLSNEVENIQIEEKPKIKTKKIKKQTPGQMSFLINDGNITF